MVAAANDRLSAEAAQLVGAVSFAVGDIMALDEPDGHYDAAIATRVIINLAECKSQIAAIREAARTIRAGGTLLLSEATREGLQQLNLFRSAEAVAVAERRTRYSRRSRSSPTA
jgi:ubiquinone/menaquinone biosynthesis C-methylase UbiE